MRRRIANWLVALARRIDPLGEAALQFHMERMLDLMVTGQSVVRITTEDMHGAAPDKGEK